MAVRYVKDTKEAKKWMRKLGFKRANLTPVYSSTLGKRYEIEFSNPFKRKRRN